MTGYRKNSKSAGTYNKNMNTNKKGDKNMKKVLAFVLALTLVFGTMSFAMAAPLSDVAGTDYEDAVTRLTSLEIIAGFPDGTYKPAEPVTRAQFAKIMVAALGLSDAAAYAQGSTKFGDVAADHWATGYINIAADMEIIVGYPDGSFKPENQVTYAESIKMIVAALGYTPKANALGGYPGGYLAVAAEQDISEDVNVVNGMAANRGDVALMVDNSLQVPMMVQKTWGEYPEYEEDEDKTLLKTKLGVDEIEGTVTDIARTNNNLDDNEIVVDGETYTLICDVDPEYIFGQEVSLFADDEEVIGVEVESDFFFDAIDVNKDGDELTLVDADKDYDIDENVSVYVDGEMEDEVVDADYAKVVLNDDGDVIFVDSYVWDDFMVVEKAEDNIIYSYGNEVDVEDYTIVKDGKSVGFDAIEEGDILFFNDDAEFAEIFNKTYQGEIEKIFVNSFKVDGEEFDYFNGVFTAQYLDDDELEDMSDTVAEQMKDEGDVVVFVDRSGNAVFVSGDLGEAETSSFLAFVIADTDDFDTRNGTKWTLDVANEAGEELNYDIDDDYTTDDYVGTWEDDIKVGAIVEITVEDDGDVEEVVLMDVMSGSQAFDTDDKYVGKYRLSSDSVVFLAEDHDPALDYDEDDNAVEVTTYGDLSFDKILEGYVYYDKDDDAVAIVVEDSDRDSDVTAYVAVADEDAVKVSGEKTWKLELYVEGELDTYYTKEDDSSLAHADNVVAGDIVEIEIDDDTNEITKLYVVETTDDDYVTGTVDKVTVGDKMIELDGDLTEYVLASDAVLFDAEDTDDIDTIALRDINEGDSVTLYLAADNSRFVKYVLVNNATEEDDDEGSSGVALTVSAAGVATVSGNVYDADADSNTWVVRASDLDDTSSGSVSKSVTAADDSGLTLDFSGDLSGSTVYKFTLYNAGDMTTVVDELVKFIQ